MRYGFFFFFSSRRRHTRSLRDWSSDVCSSDPKGQVTQHGTSGGASELGDYPEMYRVSDPVANLITTEDTGVHRGNATEKNGSASLPCERLCSLWFKFLRGVAEFFRRWTRLVVLAMSGNN